MQSKLNEYEITIEERQVALCGNERLDDGQVYFGKTREVVNAVRSGGVQEKYLTLYHAIVTVHNGVRERDSLSYILFIGISRLCLTIIAQLV